MIRLLAPLLVVPAVVLAACGDDDDDDIAPTATQAAETVPTTATATQAAATATATATTKPGSTEPVTTDPIPDPLTQQGVLMDVRIGLHPDEGFERIVFEFEGALPPAMVEYVDSASQCASGLDVEVGDEAILKVRFDDAIAHTPEGVPTFEQTAVEGSGETIVEAVRTCDFEGLVEWAVGVKAKQNFTVLTLEEPYRLVIDVRR